jgi:hypothetical protein
MCLPHILRKEQRAKRWKSVNIFETNRNQFTTQCRDSLTERGKGFRVAFSTMMLHGQTDVLYDDIHGETDLHGQTDVLSDDIVQIIRNTVNVASATAFSLKNHTIAVSSTCSLIQ